MIRIVPMDSERTIPAIADDGSYYPIGKLEAHRRGVLHLAVSVFVYRDGKLLIQKRARDKYHCGGLWANTCCTHPDWNEDPASCALRRLREELGIQLAVRPFGVQDYNADVGGGLREHERVHMFMGAATPERISIVPNPEEVDRVRWVSEEELRRGVAETPERFTPWFRIYLNRGQVFQSEDMLAVV